MSKFHDMTTEELKTKLIENKSELFNLRFRHATGQLENPMQMVVCKKNIAKIMTPKYSTACLLETSTVRQGLELMRSRGYTAIPVLNKDGRYLGSVTEGDFLRHMMQAGTTELKEHEKYRVGAIFRPDFCPALDIQASETDVIDAVLPQNF